MPSVVIEGAGNAGRAVHAPRFLEAGYKVTLVDVNPGLVGHLKKEGKYTVEVVGDGAKTYDVSGFEMLHGNEDRDAVVARIRDADLAITAVGERALPFIYPVFAEALGQRGRPLSVILAENMGQPETVFRQGINDIDPAAASEDMLYLTGACIGTMMPLPVKGEFSVVRREAYDKVIIANQAFPDGFPQVPNLEGVHNFPAHLSEKLLVHNGGHSALAYFAHQYGIDYIWEAAARSDLMGYARAVMDLAGEVLVREHPDDFDEAYMQAHTADLEARFGNQRLGDTVYRVGKDLLRKLGPTDRLAPTVRLAQKYGLDPDPVLRAIGVGIFFYDAVDEDGKPHAGDAAVRDIFMNEGHMDDGDGHSGVRNVLTAVCNFDPQVDSAIIDRTYQLAEEFNQSVHSK